MTATRVTILALALIVAGIAISAAPAQARDPCNPDATVQVCFIVCVTEPCDNVRICLNHEVAEACAPV